MKKVIALILVALFAVSGAALGEGIRIGMADPWVETTANGLMEETGFTFTLPDEAQDVVYRLLAADQLAEAQFTMDHVSYVARIRPAVEFEDISGMYYEWASVDKETDIAGRQTWSARAIDENGYTDLCLWFDAVPGLMYSLSAQAADLDGFDIIAVAEMIFHPVQMENPWTDLSKEELSAQSGMSFGLPEEAENVVYRYLQNANLAEMQFTLNGQEYTARMMPAAAFEDISGMYFTWENEQTDITVSGREAWEARAVNGDEIVDLCLWYDAVPGIMYSLTTCAADLDGFDITAVAEQVFDPMQGDA